MVTGQNISEGTIKTIKRRKWKPELGQNYWFIDSYALPTVTQNCGTIHNQNHIITGNCYRTKAMADKVAERIAELHLNAIE